MDGLGLFRVSDYAPSERNPAKERVGVALASFTYLVRRVEFEFRLKEHCNDHMFSPKGDDEMSPLPRKNDTVKAAYDGVPAARMVLAAMKLLSEQMGLNEDQAYALIVSETLQRGTR